ncbi:hypothetical protein P3S67_015558 [Capsicum chacoense]
MCGTDIAHFEDVLAPFNTYLLSVVQVMEPASEYKSALNDYIWTIDRSTIVEPIEKVTPPENPLTQPTRLTLTTFDTFEYQPKEMSLVFKSVFNFSILQRQQAEKEFKSSLSWLNKRSQQN